MIIIQFQDINILELIGMIPLVTVLAPLAAGCLLYRIQAPLQPVEARPSKHLASEIDELRRSLAIWEGRACKRRGDPEIRSTVTAGMDPRGAGGIRCSKAKYRAR